MIRQMTDDEYKYWYRKRYCFVCKEATTFLRCDNCQRFMCMKHNEKAEPEYGDYGSILNPGGYPIHKC